MTGWTRNPLLSPGYGCRLLFPPSQEPARHVPTWRGDDIPAGHARCLRCDQIITSSQWAGGTCPGLVEERA